VLSLFVEKLISLFELPATVRYWYWRFNSTTFGWLGFDMRLGFFSSNPLPVRVGLRFEMAKS
jgi:hypothetical protein